MYSFIQRFLSSGQQYAPAGKAYQARSTVFVIATAALILLSAFSGFNSTAGPKTVPNRPVSAGFDPHPAAVPGAVLSGDSASSTPVMKSASGPQPQVSSEPGRIIETLSYGQIQSSYNVPYQGAYDPANGLIYSGEVNLTFGQTLIPGLISANVSSGTLSSGVISTKYPVYSDAYDSSSGRLTLGEFNASNYSLYIQQFNPATGAISANLSFPRFGANEASYAATTLFDPVNNLVYILTAAPVASAVSSNLTVYNPSTNLANANPPSLAGFYATSMAFNSEYSQLYIAGIISVSNGQQIGVMVINMSNYSEHLVKMPGVFSYFSQAAGGIAYDPSDGMVYFSYSAYTSNSLYFSEGIGVINASSQSYVLNFSMPVVKVLFIQSPTGYGPNIAGSLTYDPNNHDMYLGQNGLSWEMYSPSVFNETVAVINGTSPTAANPVALLNSQSFPTGVNFIPAQSTAEGGTLWFSSIGLVNGTLPGNYTVIGIPPVINSLSVTPNIIDEGSSVTVASAASFGVGELSYSYSGLPAGLVSVNTTSISGTPSANGTFSIKLTVTDAAGEKVNASVQLTVNTAPTATLSYSPGTVDAGQLVQFTVTPKGGESPYTEYWVFGDGSTGTGLSPTHVYNASGSFRVAVAVTDAFGNSYTAGATVNVSLPPSNVTILASRNIVDAGLPLNLTAEAQFGSAPLSYSWKLGDGSTSFSRSLTHSYSAAGTYVVRLTVTDAAGQMSSTSYTVLVLPDPQAAINNVSALTADTPATFSASVNGGLAPYSYQWTFGDGSHSTDATPSHTYTSKGTYQVELKVTDSEGYTAASYLNVTVAGSSSTSGTSPFGTPGQNSGAGYLLLGGGLIGGFVVGSVIVALLVSRKRKPPAAQ